MMPLTQCIPRPSQSKRTRNLEPRLFRSKFLVRASARPEITGEKPMLTESERFRPFDKKKLKRTSRRKHDGNNIKTANPACARTERPGFCCQLRHTRGREPGCRLGHAVRR